MNIVVKFKILSTLIQDKIKFSHKFVDNYNIKKNFTTTKVLTLTLRL
jgi:hypothetical protein